MAAVAVGEVSALTGEGLWPLQRGWGSEPCEETVAPAWGIWALKGGFGPCGRAVAPLVGLWPQEQCVQPFTAFRSHTGGEYGNNGRQGGEGHRKIGEWGTQRGAGMGE